jgi:thiol-disulfide isomerase/thioredoxin
MRKVRLFLQLFFLIAFFVTGQGLIMPRPVLAQSFSAEQHQVVIYLFWGDGCPHCAKAKPYFEGLVSRYPGIVLKTFEVYYNQDNQQLFISMAKKYGLEQLSVPTIFIGPYYLQGYSEQYNQDIETIIVHCLQNGCIDPAEGATGFPAEITPTPSVPLRSTVTATPDFASTSTPIPVEPTIDPTNLSKSLSQTNNLEIPLIGTVNLELQSTTLSTALIAFVDGFNPCSLWVLSMLLALTLHTGSRKKVFVIGLIFLTVTASIYALFITGLFSVLKVASFLGWIQVLVALVALFFALVNIKDYFWYKEGISFTIAEDKKSGIFSRIRALMDAGQSFWGLVSATVVLAAGVSMVEFSCTAGFPVIWVNLLNAQKVNGAAFVLLLLLYMVIYQLDEMAIFFSAVVSLKASRLEEKHGRLLKLVGGMLMLTLSIVMLVNPALMNNLGSSLMIFGSAFLATLFALFIHRVLLPKFGVRIGTELKNLHPSKTGSRRN